LKVVLAGHSQKRLKDRRQRGINKKDVIQAATQIPGRVAGATRFGGFVSSKGVPFDIVVVDKDDTRKIITVIGAT